MLGLGEGIQRSGLIEAITLLDRADRELSLARLEGKRAEALNLRGVQRATDGQWTSRLSPICGLH